MDKTKMSEVHGQLESKGSYIVIYNDVGVTYYLIFHSREGQWLLPSTLYNGVEPRQVVMNVASMVTGLSSLSFKGAGEQVPITYNGDHFNLDVSFLEGNMNAPIVLMREYYDNYLWATKDRVLEKLSRPEEAQIIRQADSSFS